MEQSSNLFELQLDQPSINYLSEAARWSRFLSIIGFIYCGLMVIFGLFFGIRDEDDADRLEILACGNRAAVFLECL